MHIVSYHIISYHHKLPEAARARIYLLSSITNNTTYLALSQTTRSGSSIVVAKSGTLGHRIDKLRIPQLRSSQQSVAPFKRGGPGLRICSRAEGGAAGRRLRRRGRRLGVRDEGRFLRGPGGVRYLHSVMLL